MREEGGESGGGSCRNCGYYLKNIIKFLISHIGLVSLVVGYTMFGGYTFRYLESHHELEVKKNMSRVRENVTDQIWNITNHFSLLKEENWTTSVRSQLIAFEKSLIRAIKNEGWDGLEELNTQQWTLPGALFYSIILITTIGYGHIAPKTIMGKMVTIAYAIPGVPLMMLCLANIGDGMAHSFRFIYWRICCYACTKRPKKKKRVRSTRSSRRYPSQSGSSIRTRGSSFRRSNRASDKSVDSAFYTSSYTDPDYKMEEDMVEEELRGLGSNRQSERSHFTRSSQFNKGSDYLTPPPKEDNGRVAVLFNKYALENDGGPAEDTHRGSLNDSSDREQRSGTGSRGPGDNYREHRGREGGHGSSRRSRRDEEDLPETHHPRPHPHRLSHNPGYSDSPPPPRSPRSSDRYSHRHIPPPSRLSRMDDDYYYDDYDDYGYEEDEGDENLEERPVPIMLAVLLVVAYILGGAALFAKWEEWNFLDSVYFCFITLTTIGFGDLVPAQRKQESVELRIGLCSLYLLFGIALLAMSFNLVQEEVISKVKRVAKTLGIIKEEEEMEEDVD